jgi:Mrp family chromosome partitioning ATPase
MRAYCQHCDATEMIAPEEIYSPAFNFWCPRCQSILILQDDANHFDSRAVSRPLSRSAAQPRPTTASRAEPRDVLRGTESRALPSTALERSATSFNELATQTDLELPRATPSAGGRRATLSGRGGSGPQDRPPPPLDERDTPTRVDTEESPAPVVVSFAEPEPRGSAAADGWGTLQEEPAARSSERGPTTAFDPYTALAAELDAGIAADELSRPTRRVSQEGIRNDPTAREKRTNSFMRPRPAVTDDRGSVQGDPGAEPPRGPVGSPPSVKELADIARNLDPASPGPDARPSAPSDSGPVMARDTVRVTRASLPPTDPAQARITARREIEERLARGIAPDLPPLPNWDGGDTHRVRELAARMPGPVETGPVGELTTPDPGSASRPVEDDALDRIAVVQPMSGTTGTGSRTYERVDETPEAPEDPSPSASASTPAVGTPTQPPAGSSPPPPLPEPSRASTGTSSGATSSGGAEDLDWYALLDEALPEDAGEAPGQDLSRVVIRLPETMAPTSEADAEQVRQLQAKLEARSVHGDEESHPAQKLDAKKARELAAGGAGAWDTPHAEDDAGHAAAADDETKDYVGAKVDEDTRDFHPRKKDEDETRDNPGRDAEKAKSSDPEKTAQIRDRAGLEESVSEPEPSPRGSDSGRVPRTAETTRAASDRRARKVAPTGNGIVVEQFDRAALDAGLVCARDSSSPEADYFKQLYQRIFHSRNGSSPRVVLVTSARRGEGKTTVAANLALVAARMPGRGALLVEADPRGGDLFRSFGLRMKAEGLLEALESGKDPSSFILQFKLGMLDVLPLGVPGSDAAELISSDRIGEVVRGLVSRYPHSVIIIDGSSVLHAPDPLVLARHVDGVVLVVRADVTPREQIERARDLLGPEKVLGVVLNQAGGH